MIDSLSGKLDPEPVNQMKTLNVHSPPSLSNVWMFVIELLWYVGDAQGYLH